MISARQLQRGYKKVLEQANRLNKPLIIVSNNQPQGAVIGLDLLEKLQLDTLLNEALDEYKAGKTKSIKTKKDFEEHLKEINEMV